MRNLSLIRDLEIQFKFSSFGGVAGFETDEMVVFYILNQSLTVNFQNIYSIE
jgi:hypothetical protein